MSNSTFGKTMENLRKKRKKETLDWLIMSGIIKNM